MPTTTARLALPVPLQDDPANVPAYMLGLADALDAGANANYSGTAVMVATPGALGNLPADPIIGTFYCVSGSPPYLLYYSGESTPGTGTAPPGWRLVGQVGTNVAVMSNTSPGNSANPGIQPVWAPLDHQHASLPWSLNQTTALFPGATASDGTANAYARANHSHGVGLISGLTAFNGFLATPTTVTSASFGGLAAPGCSVTVTTATTALVILTATMGGSPPASLFLGFSITGATTTAPSTNQALNYSGGDGSLTMSAVFPVNLTAGSNVFTVQAMIAGGGSAIAENVYIIVLPIA